MDCPTCFRKMVVPQSPTGEDSKLVLTAATVQSRVVPGLLPEDSLSRRPKRDRSTAVFVIALIVAACAAAGVVFAFRDKFFKPPARPVTTKTNAPSQMGSNALVTFTPAPPASETDWTLDLEGRPFPESRAAGWVSGRSFNLEKATVQGGILTLRQGTKTPAEIAVTIHLFARQGEDLAGQEINIDAGRTNGPKVTLRWKDEAQQSVTRTYRIGYAMKIEFGAVAGGALSGKVYLCIPDDAKSCLAGTFSAEIRKPTPPKPPKTSKPAKPVAPKHSSAVDSPAVDSPCAAGERLFHYDRSAAHVAKLADALL